MIDKELIFSFDEDAYEQSERNRKELIEKLLRVINTCSNKIIELNQKVEDIEFDSDEIVITNKDIDFLSETIIKINKIGL